MGLIEVRRDLYSFIGGDLLQKPILLLLRATIESFVASLFASYPSLDLIYQSNEYATDEQLFSLEYCFARPKILKVKILFCLN